MKKLKKTLYCTLKFENHFFVDKKFNEFSEKDSFENIFRRYTKIQMQIKDFSIHHTRIFHEPSICRQSKALQRHLNSVNLPKTNKVQLIYLWNS